MDVLAAAGVVLLAWQLADLSMGVCFCYFSSYLLCLLLCPTYCYVPAAAGVVLLAWQLADLSMGVVFIFLSLLYG